MKIILQDQLKNKGVSLDKQPKGEMTKISENLFHAVAGGAGGKEGGGGGSGGGDGFKLDFKLDFKLWG